MNLLVIIVEEGALGVGNAAHSMESEGYRASGWDGYAGMRGGLPIEDGDNVGKGKGKGCGRVGGLKEDGSAWVGKVSNLEQELGIWSWGVGTGPK